MKDVALEVMKESAEEVYNLGCATTDSIVSDVSDLSSAVNTSVSVDGTWQKRGFTSLNGAVVPIYIATDRILDVEVMSRYCQACVANAPLEKTRPDKFEDFQIQHQPECGINHKGSAPTMDALGAVSISWSRSKAYGKHFT